MPPLILMRLPRLISTFAFTKYQFSNKLLTELNSSKMLYGILLDAKPVPWIGFQDRQQHLIVELWITVWYSSWFQIVYHPVGSGIGLISYPFRFDPFWNIEFWSIYTNSEWREATLLVQRSTCPCFMIQSWLMDSTCLSSCGKMDLRWLWHKAQYFSRLRVMSPWLTIRQVFCKIHIGNIQSDGNPKECFLVNNLTKQFGENGIVQACSSCHAWSHQATISYNIVRTLQRAQITCA